MERLTSRAVAGLLFGRCRSAGASGGGNHGGNATEGNHGDIAMQPKHGMTMTMMIDDDDDDDDSEYSGSVATYVEVDYSCVF